MKRRILGIIFSLMLLSFTLSNISTHSQSQLPAPTVKAIDTIIYPDYSQLYTCKQDYCKDNCLYINIQDAQLLMKIARAEGGPTLDGQLWSMRTIFNRLSNGNFGSNIWEIVSADGQFDVFTTGVYINADVNVNSHIALAMIEGGWDDTEGALYWRAENGSEDSWHENNLQYIKTVDGNRYYK